VRAAGIDYRRQDPALWRGTTIRDLYPTVPWGRHAGMGSSVVEIRWCCGFGLR